MKCEFDTSFQASFVLQSFEGVQKCKKTETLTAIMERIVKAEVGHRHGDEFNPRVNIHTQHQCCFRAQIIACLASR